MVPWIVVYSFNILGYFVASVLFFYQLSGPWKALGVVPMLWAFFLIFGHFSVSYFCIEQRKDFLSGVCNNIVSSDASSPS